MLAIFTKVATTTTRYFSFLVSRLERHYRGKTLFCCKFQSHKQSFVGPNKNTRSRACIFPTKGFFSISTLQIWTLFPSVQPIKASLLYETTIHDDLSTPQQYNSSSCSIHRSRVERNLVTLQTVITVVRTMLAQTRHRTMNFRLFRQLNLVNCCSYNYN